MAAPMSVSDMVKLIRDRWPHLPISNDNFTRPTQEFVFNIYNLIAKDYHSYFEEVREALGLGPEANPTVLNETTDNIELFMSVSKIYKGLMVNSFSFFDIIEPAPKRTQLFVRLGVLLLSHLDNERGLGLDIFRAVMEEKQEMQELENEIQELKEGINNQVIEGEELRDIIERETAKNYQMKKSYEELSREHQLLNADEARRQGVVEEHKRELLIMEGQLQQLLEEESHLRKRIVPNDLFEKLVSENKSFDEQLAVLQKQNAEIRITLAESKQQKEHFERCIEVLEQFEIPLQKFEEYQNLTTDLNKIQITIPKLEEQIKQLEKEQQDLCDNIKKSQAKLHPLKIKLEELKVASIEKINEIHQIHAEIRTAVEIAKKRHTKMQTNIQKLEEQIHILAQRKIKLAEGVKKAHESYDANKITKDLQNNLNILKSLHETVQNLLHK